MKLRKRYIALMAIIALAQASCLKDNPGNTDPRAGTNNVVEFQNTKIPSSYTSVWPQYDNGVNLTGDTGSFPINLNYTGTAAVAPANIDITLTIDQGALDDFNADQGTNYTLPPDGDYSVPMTLTIPKGVNTTQIRCVVTAAGAWDYSKTY